MSTVDKWLPEHAKTEEGETRRVGVEIELAQLEPSEIIELLQLRFGGVKETISPFVFELKRTCLGTFRVELDADVFKEHADQFDLPEEALEEEALPDKVVNLFKSTVKKSAEAFVPWEIVTDPIAMDQLAILDPIFSELREAGAAGTRESIRYAFGVHLNPELPGLDEKTILRYMQAYLVMYEWLVEHERVDVMRRVTPYIDKFENDYVLKVLDEHYSPSMDELIDDYLEFNPTRNRSLDMLPLFAHIDEKRVRAVVDDPRVKARPTLHYRLPNCEIDQPGWELWKIWQNWLQVEALAHSEDLPKFAKEYCESLRSLKHAIKSDWSETIDSKLAKDKLA